MLKGKEILLEIINNALLTEQIGSDVQQLAFDTTELKAFLTNYKNPPEDIIHLTDGMLNNISKQIGDNEESKKFIAMIKYIRGVAQLNGEKQTKINLSEDQLLKLKELEDLINKVIQKNELITKNVKERSEKQLSDYRKIITIVNSEEIFTVEDYDIIEEIIRIETPTEAESNLDSIFTYLNEFNSRKLQEIIMKEEKPEKREVINVVKNVVQEPSILDVDDQNDIFNSVVRTSSPSKQNTNIEEAERTQRIKEIISCLGYNYDELPITMKLKLIAIKDLNNLNLLADKIKEYPEILNSIKPSNINLLIYMLTNTSAAIIEDVINILKIKYNIELPSFEFTKMINTGISIFSEKGYSNFKTNVEIFDKYEVSVKKIITDNILLLTTDTKKLKNITTKFHKRGSDIKKIFDECSNLFLNTSKDIPTLVEKNLNVLEMYGFDTESLLVEENPSFSLLHSRDLASKLDQFIEVGLNETIHKDPTKAGNAFKTLIIKRIYYAYKNNYEVWASPKDNINISENTTELNLEMPITQNETYNKAIINSQLVISDTEIEKIKSEYEVMEIVDEGYRAAIYTDAPMGLLKRKTEFIFGTQIISRPKVFRVFKILINLDVELKEALLYAIIHNSVLEPHEHEFVKEAVARIGVTKDYDRIPKTV